MKVTLPNERQAYNYNYGFHTTLIRKEFMQLEARRSAGEVNIHTQILRQSKPRTELKLCDVPTDEENCMNVTSCLKTTLRLRRNKALLLWWKGQMLAVAK